MITIRRIRVDDGQKLRDLRLRALIDAPMAFGSTHVRELAFSSADWQLRCDRASEGNQAVTFFAIDENDFAIGLIGCLAKENDPTSGYIVSMWVDPRYRRQGVAQRLIDAVESWARHAGYRELRLDVTENNAAASELYLRCGFRFTGESFPYPNDPRLLERSMQRSLSTPPPVI
jgi:ribosomal protein S18 acetylase RimI-like enzyme